MVSLGKAFYFFVSVLTKPSTQIVCDTYVHHTKILIYQNVGVKIFVFHFLTHLCLLRYSKVRASEKLSFCVILRSVTKRDEGSPGAQ